MFRKETTAKIEACISLHAAHAILWYDFAFEANIAEFDQANATGKGCCGWKDSVLNTSY